MIARKLFPARLQGEQYFRWRGGEVSRIEALSDMVFAFALTLIVVSLQVPRTFAELAEAFAQLPAFAACFAVLLMCWHYNYRYHRRYGLEDFVTELLNALLLFIILIYVYPLKFLFSLLFDMIRGLPPVVRSPGGVPLVGPDGGPIPIIQGGEMGSLLLVYSGGFTGIFLLYALMNHRAYRHRRQLELDAVEVQITRATSGSHLLTAGVGVLSLLIVLANARWAAWAGMIYFLIGPAQGVLWTWQSRKIERLVAAAEARR